MTSLSTKISDLPPINIAPEYGLLPLSIADEHTVKISMSQLRQTLNFENAFSSVADGLAETNDSQIFYTYSDDTKYYALGWVNTGTGALPILDGVGNQVIYATAHLALNPLNPLLANDGQKFIGRCPDINTLRNTTPESPNQKIDVVEYTAGTHEGGGEFYYDATDTTTADDGVLCFVTTTGRRWKRNVDSRLITPEQAGAVGDGITDDTVAFKRAVACSLLNGYVPIVCGAKSYVISDTIYLMGSASANSTAGVPLVGCNWKATQFLFKPTGAYACFKLNAIPGNIVTCYMRDIHILPFNASYVEIGYGLEISGACMVPFDNLFIEQMAVNYRLNNELANTWTEFNKFTNCESRYGKVGVQFIRMAGNDSFHGTQMNIRIQVKQGGGIGFQTLGASSSLIAWLYNCRFDIKFFGGNTCYAFDIQNTNTSNNSGNFTAEGNLIFKSDDNSWFIHLGRFDTISSITYQITTEIAVKLGRFVFANRASKSSVNFVNSPLTAYGPGINYQPFDISSATAAGYNFRGVGSNFNSPMFSCLAGGDNGFYFGNIGSGEGVENWHAGFKISAGGGLLTTYNTSGMQLCITDTSYVTMSNVSLRPTTNALLGIGAATVRFNAAYVTGWNLSTDGLIPTTTATYNIGSGTNTVNNIYSQNAVIVVSDEHFKAGVQDIPEELITAVGSVKSKMWQLNAAIREKGSDARWHVGVIAQEVRDAITEAGLDWRKYGLIAEEIQSVVVEMNQNGNYVPVDPDIAVNWVNTQGFIDLIDKADSVTTDSNNVTTLTRTIFMLRMDEFNTIKLAYQDRLLSQLMNGLS